jgi:Fatty acid hydroxylase superfamily
MDRRRTSSTGSCTRSPSTIIISSFRCFCLWLFVVQRLLPQGVVPVRSWNNGIICHAFTARVTIAGATSKRRTIQPLLSTILPSTTTGRSCTISSVTKIQNVESIENSTSNNKNEDFSSSTSTTSSNTGTHHPIVPTTLNEALGVFFGSSQYHGPRLIVLFLSAFIYQRIELGYVAGSITHPVMQWLQSSSLIPLVNGLEEFGVAGMAIVFWWIQEHVMHQKLLHSQHMDWIGKEIHVNHHNQPYYHISIDSAPIMIGWLTVVHLLLRFGFSSVLPLHLIYTATIAYGMAGLFYEWTHFIVHTKVRFSSKSFWTKVKNHHARHHLINHDNYFAFTITKIDDLFGTNPDVTKVPRLKKLE